MIHQPSPPTAAIRADGPDQRWRAVGICLALAAITFAVFGQTAGFGFVNFDDSAYVYYNPQVAGGLSWKGLAWVFTHLDCHFYHPLTMLSLMADYQLHGLHAGGYHVTNVLLHTGSVILLFLVLRQMTGVLWRSAFVAAVFAIHPLRVESVAWVAERKDVLGTFFFMLTLGAYAHYVRKPNSLVRYLMVAGAFVLALLSKPTMVTLPFVLLLLDYWPLQRVEPRKLSGLILEKIPLLALAAGACVVTVLAEGKEAIATLADLSMPARIGNALVSYVLYLRQMIWPEGLAVFYPPPQKGHALWTIAFSFFLLVLITGGVLAFGRKRRWLVAGWFWYLGMLAPMIGIVQVGLFAHADRMTYLPQIGVYLLLTWAVADLSAGWNHRRTALGGLAAIILSGLVYCARAQTAYWKNDEMLWSHALGCTTGNYVAHNGLGYILFQKGSVDEAIAHYQKAVEIRPGYAEAHLNLGVALVQKGRVDEGIVHYQRVLQIRPDDAEALNNLGDALVQKGQLDEAIAYIQKALEGKPDFAEAHYNLGTAFLQKGRTDDALTEYQSALQINPDYMEAHLNLGNILAQKGRAAEAIPHFQKALQIAPANSIIQNNLAWLLATGPEASLRDGRKAVELARQAKELTGGTNPMVLHTLAAAFAEIGQFNDAKESVQKAIELARAAGRADLVERFNGELKRYEAGLPLHQ